MDDVAGSPDVVTDLETVFADRLKKFMGGVTTVPLAVCGPTAVVDPAVRACHHLIPADWFGAAIAYRSDRMLETWRSVLAGAVQNWLQQRPGLRALHAAAKALDDRNLSVVEALAAVDRELSGVSGPSLFLELEDVAPFELEARRLVQLLGELQRGGAPVFVVLTTNTHASFLAASEMASDSLEVVNMAWSGSSLYHDRVARLSPVGRQYLRAVINEPATNDALRVRLGAGAETDREASQRQFGHAEVRDAGLVTLDNNGVIAPADRGLDSLLG